LQDRSVVDSKVVLPFILEKTWQKNVVVFSGSAGHVKNGALFCMFPNNEEHGKQAASLLLKEARGYPVEKKIYPTEGLQKAINSRTAEHLGLDISKSELREFDLVFPLSN
ncbi:MAG: ABC transporter substrate-binding protein, partial [Pseudomonadota bacterium]